MACIKMLFGAHNQDTALEHKIIVVLKAQQISPFDHDKADNIL
jgi:hypothetical protein